MGEMQFIGYLVSAIITLGGFVAVIMKFIQPINELRVAIQKFNDNIEMLTKANDKHDKILEKHEDEIVDLKSRVGMAETKIEMFHRE